MFRVDAAAGLLVVAVVAALASPASAEVTATHGLLKLRPTDPAPTGDRVVLVAAANEVESFQAVITGGVAGEAAIAAALSDLVGPVTIPAAEAVLYREAYLDVTYPSDGNGLTGRLPDALIPAVDPFVGEERNAFPFDVPAHELRTIWVDLHVPRGAPAGRYTGALTVTSRGSLLRALPVELTVLPFELPSTPSYATAFGMNWYGPCLAHSGSRDCGGDAARFDRLRQLYGIAGLNNRLSISGIAGQPPGGSGSTRNFDRYDAAYGPLLDGTARTILPGARLTAIEIHDGRHDEAAFSAWASHFRERGWFDRLFDYTCDEPPMTCAWTDIPPREAAAHAADPELRTLVTTTTGHARDHGFYDTTDILVPIVNFVEGKPGADYAGDNSQDYRDFRAATGGTSWIYGSCMSHGCGGTVTGEYDADPDLAGWPSLVVDHSALRNRAMPWVAFPRGFTGELYWDTVFALAVGRDAWRSQYEFSGNGDGTLFYPGTPARIGGRTDIPVESIRLKEIRDGIEDYEYLTILASLEGRAAAEAAALALFPHAWSAGELSPEEFLAARRALGLQIASHFAPAPVAPGGWRGGSLERGWRRPVAPLAPEGRTLPWSPGAPGEPGTPPPPATPPDSGGRQRAVKRDDGRRAPATGCSSAGGAGTALPLGLGLGLGLLAAIGAGSRRRRAALARDREAGEQPGATPARRSGSPGGLR